MGNLPTPSPLLGFLAAVAFPVTGGQAYLAGILVTCTRGIPREFRHSEPVTPGRVQQLIYGDTLQDCLGSEVLAPALLGALERQPDLILFERQDQALFARFAVEHPPAALLVPEQSELVEYLSGDVPLEPLPLPAWQGSLHLTAYLVERSEHGVRAADTLQCAGRTMRLAGPFTRIRTVLSEVAQLHASRGGAAGRP
jgi:hypothetical protein